MLLKIGASTGIAFLIQERMWPLGFVVATTVFGPASPPVQRCWLLMTKSGLYVLACACWLLLDSG